MGNIFLQNKYSYVPYSSLSANSKYTDDVQIMTLNSSSGRSAERCTRLYLCFIMAQFNHYRLYSPFCESHYMPLVVTQDKAEK